MFADLCSTLEEDLESDLKPREPSGPMPISVNPSTLHYLFNFDRKFNVRKTVCVTNSQDNPVRLSILPTKTQYFTLAYQTPSVLLFGMSMKIVVTFKASQPRHYYDKFQINCVNSEGNYEFDVGLSAEPLYDLYIPRQINFGCVNIKKVSIYTLNIKAPGKEELGFSFLLTNPNGDLDIIPSEGVAKPKTRGVEVSFIYRPTAYITSVYYVQLFIANISKSPYTIKCIGNCMPNIPKKSTPPNKVEKQKFLYVNEPVLEDLIEVKKAHDLDCTLMHMDGVNKFLMLKQFPDRNPHELRGPLNWYIDEDISEYNTYMKYCYWKAETNRKENQLALVKDEPLLGFDIKTYLSPEKCYLVDKMRAISSEVYMNRLADEGDEYQPGKPCNTGLSVRKRLIRSYDTTDFYFQHSDKLNDPWLYQLKAINQFVQAGRKVIILNRLLKKIDALKVIKKKDIQRIVDSKASAISADKWLQFEKEYDVKREIIIKKKLEEQQMKSTEKKAKPGKVKKH